MKRIKSFSLILSLLSGLQLMTERANAQKADSLTWYTDVMKANEASNATGKPIFALFTGSDWCIWCKKLQQNVFSKAEFIEWAKKNVVLLELDYPRYKQLSPELKSQNQQLLQQFKVQGFPTVWIFFLKKDETAKQISITPLGSCGYPQNPEPGKEQLKFIKDADEILKNKTAK
jgi:thioredoxin-related protein